jgi:hypothetical protein
MILGSVAQLPEVMVKGAAVSVALVARRSAQRAGTRHWRRGVRGGRSLQTQGRLHIPCFAQLLPSC